MTYKKVYLFLSIALLLLTQAPMWAKGNLLPTGCCEPSSIEKLRASASNTPDPFKTKYPAAVKILNALNLSDIRDGLFDNLKVYLETDFQNPVGYTRDCVRLTKAAKYAIAQLEDNSYVVRLTRPLDFEQSRNIDSEWLADLLREEYPHCIKNIDHGCLGYGDFVKGINMNDNTQYVLFTNGNIDTDSESEMKADLGRVVKRSEIMSNRISDEFLQAQGVESTRSLNNIVSNVFFLNYPEPDFAAAYISTPFYAYSTLPRVRWRWAMNESKWLEDAFDFKAFYYNEPSMNIPKPQNSREYYRCEFKKDANDRYYLHYVRDGKKVSVGGFLSGTINYVIDCMGRFYVVPEGIPFINRKYHSMLLGGAVIMGAGQIKVDNGVILMLNNNSGHYTPSCASLEGAVREILMSSFNYSMNSSSVQTTDQTGGSVTICTWTTNTSLFRVSADGDSLKSISSNTLVVYPNPGKDIFNLQLGLTETQTVMIEIYGEIGNKVYESERIVYEKEEISLDLSSIAPGFYILQVRYKDKVMRDRIVLNP